MEDRSITTSKLVNAIEVLVWYTRYLEDVIQSKNNVYSFEDAKYDIVQTVTMFFDVSKEELEGPKRNTEIVLPRKIIMYLLKQHTRLSLKEIGKMFNRDHSTVLHSVQGVEDMLSYDHSFRVLFNLIHNELNKRIGRREQDVPENIHTLSKAQ